MHYEWDDADSEIILPTSFFGSRADTLVHFQEHLYNCWCMQADVSFILFVSKILGQVYYAFEITQNLHVRQYVVYILKGISTNRRNITNKKFSNGSLYFVSLVQSWQWRIHAFAERTQILSQFKTNPAIGSKGVNALVLVPEQGFGTQPIILGPGKASNVAPCNGYLQEHCTLYKLMLV